MKMANAKTLEKSKVKKESPFIGNNDNYEKLYNTFNYDNFCFIKGNRAINKGNLLRIMGSILTKGYLKVPILVKVMEDGRLGIVDGQHRFEAVTKLARGEFEGLKNNTQGLDKLVLPIYYIIIENASLNIIPNLNISKGWNDADFINSYAAQGNENYINIKRLQEEYPDIMFTRLYLQIVKARAGFYKKNRIFESDVRNGTLEFKDYDNAVKICKKIMDFDISGTSFRTSPWGSYLFFASILKLIKMPSYNHELMIEKVKKNPQYLVKQHKLRDYITQFSYIFNYNSRQSAKVYFENYL